MRTVAGPFGVVACVWLAIACSAGPGASPTPTTRSLAGTPLTDCVIHGEVPVKAEVPGLCGTLVVPEDPATPGGRTIPLRVAVVPALAADPRPDPFFAIAGGPRDASSQFFAWLPGLFLGVHTTRDIVLVDQRGTGDSKSMSFPEPPDTAGLTDTDADARLTTWARDALAGIDADPRFYTSSIAADDLDLVRAALGYDRIDLYGTSYGGTLAQYYLRQHGDHVRVAILDGSTPVDVPVMERMAANSQHALDLLFTRCAADPGCHAAFPDLASEWKTLAARLAATVTTNVINPDTGQPATIDLVTAATSIHDALRIGGTAAQLPMAIHLAYEGKWDLASQVIAGVSSGGPVSVMAEEILCSEAWARFDPDAVARDGQGSYALSRDVAAARSRAAICRHLPKGIVPANDGAPLLTTVPILWLTADGDPQDPPANLSAVAGQQPNAVIAVMPAQEHVVGHLGCGPDVISAVLDAGTAKGVDLSCLANGAAPSPTFRLQ